MKRPFPTRLNARIKPRTPNWVSGIMSKSKKPCNLSLVCFVLLSISRVVINVGNWNHATIVQIWDQQSPVEATKAPPPPPIPSTPKPQVQQSLLIPQRWTSNDMLINTTIIKEEDLLVYSHGVQLVEAFASHGITLLLYLGSLLGARRHLGMLPWGDKDLDFIVLSTNKTAIDNVLNSLNSLNYTWRYNKDGKGPGSWGFGYHIDFKEPSRTRVELMSTKRWPPKVYIDLWLFGSAKETGMMKCLGIENGCKRWARKYINQEPHLHEIKSILPPRMIPFGPYLFPAPQDPDAFLDTYYTDTWREYCNGFRLGKEKCAPTLTDKYPFVYRNKEIVTVKRGNQVLLTLDDTRSEFEVGK